MTTHTIFSHLQRVLRFCLMTFALTACTYDYFEDEQNFRIYVPQIKNGEIKNLYVAFHDSAGRHLMTREIIAPFDKDELMIQGILRFKLPPGKNYTISCFADYDPNAPTRGELYANSHMGKTLIESTNIYASRTTNPRSYLSTIQVYPIGHPMAFKSVEVNIEKEQCYKGKVAVNFRKLPSLVSRIDMYYKGLSTKYRFDGTLDRFASDNQIKASFNTSDYLSAETVKWVDVLNPSAGLVGVGVHNPSTPQSVATAEPLELEIHLIDATNNIAGTIRFTRDDFKRLKEEDPTKVPVGADGNPLDHLVLEPQQTISFTFEGFTLIKIDLVGWGDIGQGGTSPM